MAVTYKQAMYMQVTYMYIMCTTTIDVTGPSDHLFPAADDTECATPSRKDASMARCGETRQRPTTGDLAEASTHQRAKGLDGVAFRATRLRSELD